jgi:hypothetical protein
MGFAHIDAELVFALEIRHAEVLDMNVLATRDGAQRHTDDLVVASHGFTFGDVTRRDLVARRNQPAHHQRFDFRRNACARHKLARRDHDIVVGMEADDRVIDRHSKRSSGQRRDKPPLFNIQTELMRKFDRLFETALFFLCVITRDV